MDTVQSEPTVTPYALHYALPISLSSAPFIETLGTPKFHIAFREHLLSVCGADYFALYHSSDGQLQNSSAGGLREGSVASKQARLYADGGFWRHDPGL